MITKESRSTDRPHVLVVEDDPGIGKLLATGLREAAYSVTVCTQGLAGLALFQGKGADLVVLDLNLPDIDGLQVCQRIREGNRHVPIVMLTARAAKQDVVRGLELGADEYLTKPFSMIELVARIRALFRRIAALREHVQRGGDAEVIQRGALRIDPTSRLTSVNARQVMLTSKEFDLLLLFARNPGRVFSRGELLNRVWGVGFEGFEHTVNTHINRLRNKLEATAEDTRLIETVWGEGYRFALPAADA